MNPQVCNRHSVTVTVSTQHHGKTHTAPNLVSTHEMNNSDDYAMVGELRQPHRWLGI